MVGGIHLTDEELAILGVTRTKKNGQTKYIVPCDVCGELIETTKYSTNSVYKCKSCHSEEVAIKNKILEMVKWRNNELEAKELGADYEHFHRFENATKKFNKATYSKDIEKARKAMGKFDSVPEAVACIELLHIGARVIVQQKIGSFTVDFCLPKEKVVIEIDGSLYHKDKDKEFKRDYVLKNHLGDDWIIKHIPSDSVMSNHKFFGQCIKKLIDDRRFELCTKKSREIY